MMKKAFFSGWTINQWLALLAVILGAVAVFGNPYGGGALTVPAKELALLVAGGADHVTVHELADWIIRHKSDYRLIDLRDAEAVASYYIPGAEHVLLSALPDYPISRNEKIVLYSEDEVHAAQAWILLKAQGFRGVYTLEGGLQAWKDRILFPALPETAGAEELETARNVSRFFGGTPQASGEETVAKKTVELPKVELPARAPGVAGKKKPREGC
ncbi:MAG: rhodanese-like domain-containing protein [bacterium]|nr:rhodanese-like domain-containing protein [bacterium]